MKGFDLKCEEAVNRVQHGRGKREIPEKTCRTAASSNPGATPPEIEPVSPMWEVSSLTTTPPRPRTSARECTRLLRDEQFDGHLWSRGSGNSRKSLDKCVLQHVQRAAVGLALIDLMVGRRGNDSTPSAAYSPGCGVKCAHLSARHSSRRPSPAPGGLNKQPRPEAREKNELASPEAPFSCEAARARRHFTCVVCWSQVTLLSSRVSPELIESRIELTRAPPGQPVSIPGGATVAKRLACWPQPRRSGSLRIYAYGNRAGKKREPLGWIKITHQATVHAGTRTELTETMYWKERRRELVNFRSTVYCDYKRKRGREEVGSYQGWGIRAVKTAVSTLRGASGRKQHRCKFTFPLAQNSFTRRSCQITCGRRPNVFPIVVPSTARPTRLAYPLTDGESPRRVVVEGCHRWLDYSPPTSANRVRFPIPDFTLAATVPDDAAGRRVFSRIYDFPPPTHSHAASYSRRSNLRPKHSVTHPTTARRETTSTLPTPRQTRSRSRSRATGND
ncbi:hypothetical protein PR048_032330 [Dryococelus australis]|uniref:Uncharacterized protein n=1 Tax=Dryococelus australis TaxID=614101 RepID=A0ABQ9G4Y0_9NEOP|nr:hypothetical protein PR048_032330 [Dryococelus australis]